MSASHLRPIANPFVVAAPAGARIRTRLQVSTDDEQVLCQVAGHLGRLAGADLAERCREGRLEAKGRAISRRRRKQAMTAASSARWAGAITRTSEDAWQAAERNLYAEARSLRARTGRIRHRLQVPIGGRAGRLRGYASQDERLQKQRRLQRLSARLAEVDQRLAYGRVSICRGGRKLARARHNLDDARLSREQWRERWSAQRWFITADGEAAAGLGNLTIRWHPGEGWVEIRLPRPLEHLANRPSGRYRLSCPVWFPYRGDEVAAQTASGAVRYDIIFDPDKGRWYLDASWKTAHASPPSLAVLRRHPVLAVDVNADHLATWVVTADGNPAGSPLSLPLDLVGLPASARDGRLRAVISDLVRIARHAGCAAVVIENLDFAQARSEGREAHDRRPGRGSRGRSWRRLVAGIPTARFRDRLVQMSYNAGLAVVAIDPAYTSTWAAQHWLGSLQTQFSPEISGHQAAALVIGRRGLGQRARRRARCDSTPPEDGRQRATDSAVRPAPASAGLAGPAHRKIKDREAPGQPHVGTRPARPTGPPWSTRQPRTARGRPPPSQPARAGEL